MTAPALTYDADFAPAAALIADSTRAAILRALLPDRPLAAGELARLAGVELLDGLLRRGLIQEQPSGRTERSDTPSLRFEVTGAGAKVLGSFGLNIAEIRHARRRFAGSCIDWTQRRGHLNGALAAAITSRCSSSAGSSGGRRGSAAAACASPRPASRDWPAPSGWTSRSCGRPGVGSCRSCENSW